MEKIDCFGREGWSKGEKGLLESEAMSRGKEVGELRPFQPSLVLAMTGTSQKNTPPLTYIKSSERNRVMVLMFSHIRRRCCPSVCHPAKLPCYIFAISAIFLFPSLSPSSLCISLYICVVASTHPSIPSGPRSGLRWMSCMHAMHRTSLRQVRAHYALLTCSPSWPLASPSPVSWPGLEGGKGGQQGCQS